jgi:DNA repair protein RecO (recombination protein O)
MSTFTTPAILLRRSSYGDYDLIVTFLTLQKGKLTVIAKNAKKSRKRFSGVLELFSLLHLVCTGPRGRGMPVLQEATIEHPFSNIRGNIMKTAYASYWVELITLWLEEKKTQTRIYHLLQYCLSALDAGHFDEKNLSIIFQIRFLTISGLSPNFSRCSKCRMETDQIAGSRLAFELAKGGILCQKCASKSVSRLNISKGMVKQLLWIQANDLKTVRRLKFNRTDLRDGQKLLEAFVVYHLGREPKSLKFLNNLR